MAFNLEQKDGRLLRPSEERYYVYADHPAYEYLWHACLSFEAMGIAVSARKNLDIPNNGHLSLRCKAFGCTVVLPAHSVVDAVLAQKPDERPFIEITFEWNSKREKVDWAVGIRKWMQLSLASGFIELYEQNIGPVHRRNKSVAAAAKVVRDACSHQFKIAINSAEGVDLDDLKIGIEHRNHSLWDFIDLGDFFVLAMRMFSEPKSKEVQQ
jgi:hypothetical protein